MRVRGVAIAVGIGVTAFLSAAAAGVELRGADVPTLLTVLPVALLAAIVAVGLGYVGARRAAAPTERGALTGVAAFGYAIVLLVALRTAVPATRRTLGLTAIGSLAVLAALIAAAGVRYRATP